jgi:hypothetical protein
MGRRGVSWSVSFGVGWKILCKAGREEGCVKRV